MPRTDGLFVWYAPDEVARCTARPIINDSQPCGLALPTLRPSDPWNHSLLVRRARLMCPQGGRSRETFIGKYHTCRCMLDLFVRRADDGSHGYSFRCDKCECYRPLLTWDNWCVSCLLTKEGIRDPYDLYDSLQESGPLMNWSRSHGIEALLRCLLVAPQLVCVAE